jgi:SARP family transcriptional regulator, regulator of embCAB operon
MMTDGLDAGRAFAVPTASGSDGSAIQLGVLGPVRIRVDGVSLPLGTPKQRVVLAVLIVNANRPVAIDTLIGAAWDQRPPPGARATLHAYISNLRKLMSTAGIDRSALASAPPGYQLSLPDGQYDFGRFTAEKTAGVRAAAAEQFEQASSHLATALAQWRGPVLEDLRDFQFVETLSVALEEERVLTHIAHAEAEIACGRPHAAIGELEALTAAHGYREPLWAQLITAYYLADRQSDALGAYQRLKSLLADDLGIDPGVTIRELHQRILRQESLDVRKAAQSHAEDTLVAQSDSGIRVRPVAAAALRGADGQRHPLAGTATRIGRSPDNDVVLSDAKVSRHHAVITADGTVFSITDLGSANGVRVRGRRIDPSAEVHHGDRIRIGDQEFTLEAEPQRAT